MRAPTATGTCTFEPIDDTTACRPCNPVADCFDDCGRCELCLGRETLPDERLTPRPDGARRAPMVARRPAAVIPACTRAVCPTIRPTDFYCVTGCCRPTLI